MSGRQALDEDEREASIGDTAEPVLYSDTPTVSLTSTLTVEFRLQ